MGQDGLVQRPNREGGWCLSGWSQVNAHLPHLWRLGLMGLRETAPIEQSPPFTLPHFSGHASHELCTGQVWVGHPPTCHQPVAGERRKDRSVGQAELTQVADHRQDHKADCGQGGEQNPQDGGGNVAEGIHLGFLVSSRSDDRNLAFGRPGSHGFGAGCREERKAVRRPGSHHRPELKQPPVRGIFRPESPACDLDGHIHSFNK